jgi:predicted MFS family arabinose efflux permease
MCTIVLAMRLHFHRTCVLLFAQVYGVLVSGRIITGVAVGLFSSTIFLYSSELSPPHIRGKLASSNQVIEILL